MKTAKALSLEAATALKSEDLTKATEKYRALAEVSPKSLETLLGLVEVLVKTKQYKDAGFVMISAQQIEPNNKRVPSLSSSLTLPRPHTHPHLCTLNGPMHFLILSLTSCSLKVLWYQSQITFHTSNDIDQAANALSAVLAADSTHREALKLREVTLDVLI